MCESCIDRLFLSGPAPCPICKTTLRKSNFVSQTFEDLLVEKEIQIRKRIGRNFNKLADDFDSVDDYNDYLEYAESLSIVPNSVHNLIHDIDVENTKKIIDRYKEANKDLIAANASKILARDKAVKLRLDRELKEKQLLKEAYLAQALDREKTKHQEQNARIGILASSTSKEAIKKLKQETLQSKVPIAAFEKIKPVQLDMDDLNMDVDIHDDELLKNRSFTPHDNLYSHFKDFKTLSSYNDPFTLHLRTEKTGNVARAGGYVPLIFYTSAIRAAFNGIS